MNGQSAELANSFALNEMQEKRIYIYYLSLTQLQPRNMSSEFLFHMDALALYRVHESSFWGCGYGSNKKIW